MSDHVKRAMEAEATSDVGVGMPPGAVVVTDLMPEQIRTLTDIGDAKAAELLAEAYRTINRLSSPSSQTTADAPTRPWPSDDVTAAVRRDWRYAHIKAHDEYVANVLSSDLGIAIDRVEATLTSLARRGSAGAWLENESLLAIRLVLEELLAARRGGVPRGDDLLASVAGWMERLVSYGIVLDDHGAMLLDRVKLAISGASPGEAATPDADGAHEALLEELRDEEDCLECGHSRAAHDRSWRCAGGDDESGDHCPCRGFVAPTCEHCGRELEGRKHLPQGGYCVLAPVDGGTPSAGQGAQKSVLTPSGDDRRHPEPRNARDV